MPTTTVPPACRRARAPGGLRRRWRRCASTAGLASAAALALTLAVPRPAAADVPPCPDNLLANAGFDAGFSARGRIAEVVAGGWTSWYATVPGVDGLNYPPDFQPRRREPRDDQFEVLQGLWSQQFGTDFATHTAGLWQTVAVPPGSIIQAYAWAYAWASRGDDPRRSEPPGTYALDIGIDPLARGDPLADGILWTAPITVTDVWVPLGLEVPVDESSVTFILRGRPLQIIAHNVSRWDSTCLRVVGGIGTPTAEPTAAPRPTRTPSPAPPGFPTPTPNLATVEAMALALADATVRADGLATRAAGRSDLSGPTAGDGRVFLGLPETVDERGADVGGDVDGGDWPAGPSSRDRFLDHVGLLALALAAYVGGVVLGLGRGHQH